MRGNVQLHTATTRTSSPCFAGTFSFKEKEVLVACFEALAGTPLDLQGEGSQSPTKKAGLAPRFLVII